MNLQNEISVAPDTKNKIQFSRNSGRMNFNPFLWFIIAFVFLAFAITTYTTIEFHRGDSNLDVATERLAEIEQKIENGEDISEDEQNEFCSLLEIVKGYQIENCDRLDIFKIRELLEYIKVIELIDDNKQFHILQEHHAWSRLFENPDWKKVRQIILKVLQKGKEVPYKTVSKKVLKFEKETIEVIYRKFKSGKIRISDAWVKTIK